MSVPGHQWVPMIQAIKRKSNAKQQSNNHHQRFSTRAHPRKISSRVKHATLSTKRQIDGSRQKRRRHTPPRQSMCSTALSPASPGYLMTTIHHTHHKTSKARNSDTLQTKRLHLQCLDYTTSPRDPFSKAEQMQEVADGVPRCCSSLWSPVHPPFFLFTLYPLSWFLPTEPSKYSGVNPKPVQLESQLR